MSKWEEIKIKDIGKVITGKTPSKNNPEYWGENFMFVTPTDFKNDSKYITKVGRGISNKGITALKKIKLPPNSILVSCIGSDMGKVAITTKESITNQQINSIIVEKDKFDADFIYYFLKYSYPTLKAYSDGGSTMPIINKSDFADLDLYIPKEKHMQSKIRKSLSSLDSKIELLRKQNQTLENIAQTLFKRWFIDFEFPNEDGKPYKSSGGEMANSELGEIPEGWRAEAIGLHLKLEIGGNWGMEEKQKGLVPAICLRGTDLQDLKENGCSYDAPIRWVKPDSIKKRVIKECEILIGGSGLGPIGRTLCVHNNILSHYDMPIIYSNFCKKFTATNKHYAMYLEFYLDRLYKCGKMNQYHTGTAIPNLDVNGLMHEIVLIADERTIVSFGHFLELKLSKHFSIEKKVLKNILNALLPKLMSGQIRVKTND